MSNLRFILILLCFSSYAVNASVSRNLDGFNLQEMFKSVSKLPVRGPVLTLATLAAIEELSIPAAVDASVFAHRVAGGSEELLAAAVHVRPASVLALYKLQLHNLKWHIVEEVGLLKATAITSHDVPEGTILLVTENLKSNEDTLLVVLLDDNLRMNKLQLININTASQVILKNIANELILIVHFSTQNNSNSVNSCAIYKWRGSHFDYIQRIDTNSVHISVAVMKNTMFLGAAIKRSNHGQKSTVSKVYRYSSEKGQFILFQNIPTTGAVSVTLFQVQRPHSSEYYVLFVNAIPGLSASRTVIHRLSADNVFAPHQSIESRHALQHWRHMQVKKDISLLICTTTDSAIIYQYTDWKFYKVQSVQNVVFNKRLFKTKIVKLGGKLLIAAINSSGDGQLSLYKPIFIQEDIVGKFKIQLRNGCEEIAQKTKSLNVMEGVRAMSAHFDKSRAEYSNFQNSYIEHLHTERLIINNSIRFDEAFLKGIRETFTVLKIQNRIIKKISDVFNLYLRLNNLKRMPNFICSRARVGGRARASVAKGITLVTLNGFNVHDFKEEIFMKEIGVVKQNTLIDRAKISEIHFENINNIPLNHFLGLVKRFVHKHGLVVRGNVTVRGELDVGHNLDVIVWPGINILMKTGAQRLPGALRPSTLRVHSLVASNVNGIDQQDILDIIDETNATSTGSFILQKLNVQELYLYKLDIDLVNLRKNSLTKQGVQEFESSLLTNVMTTRYFNSPITGNGIFYSIVLSDININNDIKLINLYAKTLSARDSIDEIQIKRWKLDVLTVNSKKSLDISADKLFGIVEVINKIKIRKNEKKVLLNQYASLQQYHFPVHVTGNVFLYGNATVGRSLFTTDLVSANESFRRLSARAIKITHPRIEIPVVIKTSISLRNADVDSLNDVLFVELVKATDEVVAFSHKQFGSVVIMKYCGGIQYINKVNLKEFATRVLQLNNNEDIYNKKIFDECTIKRIQANNIYFGDTSMENLITYTDDYHFEAKLVIENDMVIQDFMKIINIKVIHQISGFDINNILVDTLYSGMTHYTIKSNNMFYQPILIQKLNPKKELFGISVKNLSIALNWKKIINVPSSIMYDTVSAFNIVFYDSLDAISVHDFGKRWLLYEGEQTFMETSIIHSVRLIEEVKLIKSLINGYRTNIFESILQIDDNVDVDTVEVEQLSSVRLLPLLNNLNSIRVDDLLLRSSKTQTIIGLYNFQYGLSVDGNLQFSCMFESDTRNINKYFEYSNKCDHHLYIRGNAIFSREPSIGTIGRSEVRGVRAGAWFLSEDVAFRRPAALNTVTCLQSLHAMKQINTVDLTSIVSTYLSKSQDQIIWRRSILYSACATSVQAYNTNIDRVFSLNVGSSLQEFVDSILHTEQDTDLPNAVQFEHTLSCGDLDIRGEINDIDLTLETVSRERRFNNISPGSTFGNMIIHNLSVTPAGYLNGILLHNWLNNAVLKYKSYQKVYGLKHLASLYAHRASTNSMTNYKLPEDVLIFNSTAIIIKSNKYFHSQMNIPAHFLNAVITNKVNTLHPRHLDNMVSLDAVNVDLLGPKTFRGVVRADNIRVHHKHQN